MKYAARQPYGEWLDGKSCDVRRPPIFLITGLKLTIREAAYAASKGIWVYLRGS